MVHIRLLLYRSLTFMFTFLQFVIQGASITVAVTLVALPFGFIVGVVLALFYLYGGRVLSGVTAIFGTAMRGIPPIVLLFILFFVISGTVSLTPFWAGSLSLGIISSAYQMEIFRGAILAVGPGQMMAARAVGMSRWRAIRFVILPQALRLAIPPWSNEAAIVLKDSSLVYALGVEEILRRAQLLAANTQQPFLAYGAAALIYFVLVFTVNRFLDWLQKRSQIPGMHLSV
jgi:polar amino acid transport system permease protein